VTARATYGDTYYFLKRQLAWAAIGVFAMIVTMQIDYDSWRKLAWPVLIVALLLLLVVLVPGFGTAIRGSRRWLDIGPLTFQPSEVAKLAMVLFMASFLSNRIGKMHLFTRGLLPPLIIVGIVFGLIVL